MSSPQCKVDAATPTALGAARYVRCTSIRPLPGPKLVRWPRGGAPPKSSVAAEVPSPAKPSPHFSAMPFGVACDRFVLPLSSSSQTPLKCSVFCHPCRRDRPILYACCWFPCSWRFSAARRWRELHPPQERADRPAVNALPPRDAVLLRGVRGRSVDHDMPDFGPLRAGHLHLSNCASNVRNCAIERLSCRPVKAKVPPSSLESPGSWVIC